MKRMIKNSEPFTVIGIHNHPHSTVPSMDDIMRVWERKQKYGIIACHNGNVYKYRVLGEFDYNEVNFFLDRLNREIYNDNRQAQNISVLLKNLRECNIEMDVFLWE